MFLFLRIKFAQYYKAVLFTTTISLFISGLPLFTAQNASAATSNDFSAGNIISDSVFFDGNAMTAAEVQGFLNQKVPNCTINNGQASHAAGAQYGSTTIADTCLKDYRETTPNMGPQAGLCSGYIGATSETAAAIIAKVGAACNISQKVLLVLLEKEQSLISDSWPTVRQFTQATGFECYDNGLPCVGVNAGFFKQVWSAARQFQRYGTGTFTWYPVGRFSNIAYQANNSDCGTKSVFIENRATAALYYYTSYTPNPAALSNLYGTGDICSAYGNRNFWRMFTDWFGSTQIGANSQVGLYSVNSAGDLIIHRGTGKGGWVPSTQIGVGWQSMTNIIGIGDFNSDSKRDVISLNSSGTLTLHPTDGANGWGTATVIANGWNPNSLLVDAGDFDENGTQDLISRDSAGDLWLHRGNGSNGFVSSTKIGNGWNGLDTIIGVGDWDGDRHQDLIGRVTNGDLILYPGNGAGGWKIGAKKIGNGWQSLSNISVIGDYDGDGFTDLVAKNAAGDLNLYRGNGQGGWAATASKIGTGWANSQIVSGIGSKSLPVRKALVHIGNGSGSWKTVSKILVTGFPDGDLVTSVGDLDLNGTNEIVWRDLTNNLQSQSLTAAGLIGTPRLLLQNVSQYNLLIGAGDVNSDGIPDILARDNIGDFWLLRSIGNGTVESPIKVGNGWNMFTTIFNAGDFTGDGISDLLSIDMQANLLLYAGTGSSSWSSPRQVGTGWGQFDAIFSPGDFSGDGYTDIIARNRTGGGLFIYKSNGRSGWIGSTQIGSGWGGFTWIG